MTFDRKKLLAILSAVLPGIAKKELIEQSSCFIFTAGEVISYNDEISIRALLDLGNFQGAVPAIPLITLLEKLSDDIVIIEHKSSRLMIKGKRKRGLLRTHSEIILPVKRPELPKKLKKLPADFGDVITTAASSASPHDTRIIFTAVNITEQCAEATDNQQITQVSFKTPCPLSFLIPAAQAQMIASYAPTHVYLGDGWVYFRTKTGILISCRTIAGTFPDIAPLLTIKGVRIRFPKMTQDAITRTMIFLDTEFEKEYYITISISDNSFRLHSEGTKGSFDEILPVKYTGKPVAFDIHPQLLESALTRLRDIIIGERALLLKGEYFTHAVRLKAAASKIEK